MPCLATYIWVQLGIGEFSLSQINIFVKTCRCSEEHHAEEPCASHLLPTYLIPDKKELKGFLWLPIWRIKPIFEGKTWRKALPSWQACAVGLPLLCPDETGSRMLTGSAARL